ncbi:fumarylacetoacetate hydrolase family protein [Roseateles violae]|uniref:Fumarylacetoacetate hydrolase family protein n=1 Tax=Roseateles violae TaxID=3058042 RepID=A0ABT8DNM4_9BURK|nr:fumarylacetoacetate hydrolase family protein [Pelomonas sp. PFR6]MDN3919596.1 fumarylacetoacetate hydrolase family protein [Pelomonas sp. PFR6]
MSVPSSAHPAPDARLVEALSEAWRLGRRLDAEAFAGSVPDEAAAYAVHDGLAAALGWLPAGQPQHWKSGGASRAAAILHAPLAPKGVRGAVDGGAVEVADLRLHAPAIEAEIALRLGSTVTAEQAAALTREEALALIDAMTVSAELVSSRWQQGGEAPALLRMADAQSHGALALAPWLPLRRDVDWSAQRCSIAINGAAAQSARGSHALGDPGWLVLDWLRHASRHGQALPAGSVVTTGAWLVVKGLQAGDRARVAFDGIAAVEVRI